jgi:hypothetical protein
VVRVVLVAQEEQLVPPEVLPTVLLSRVALVQQVVLVVRFRSEDWWVEMVSRRFLQQSQIHMQLPVLLRSGVRVAPAAPEEMVVMDLQVQTTSVVSVVREVPEDLVH